MSKPLIAGTALAGAISLSAAFWLYTINQSSIPQTYLDASDVALVLGCFHDKTETREVKDEQNRAAFRCKNLVNDKTFELEITSSFNGNAYRTYVLAERIGGDTLEMKSIIFDNEPEKLRNAKEIYSVLNFIGAAQVRAISMNGGSMPRIHENKGQFSPIGRLITRWLPAPSPDGIFF